MIFFCSRVNFHIGLTLDCEDKNGWDFTRNFMMKVLPVKRVDSFGSKLSRQTDSIVVNLT